jgi:hypothetical protein
MTEKGSNKTKGLLGGIVSLCSKFSRKTPTMIQQKPTVLGVAERLVKWRQEKIYTRKSRVGGENFTWNK